MRSSQASASALDSLDQQECFAFIWREPSVLPWAGTGQLKPKPPTPTTSSYSSYVPKPAAEAVDGQPPGSFFLLEAGAKGGFAQLLSRDIFMGVFSVRKNRWADMGLYSLSHTLFEGL